MTQEQIDKLIAERQGLQGFVKLCGIEYAEVTPGSCAAVCTVEQHHLNPFGIAHGGLTFTLMDTAAGVAATAAGDGTCAPLTLCSSAHFLRPVRPGRIQASAKVIKAGRSTGLVSVQVTDEAGTLLTTGEFEIFYKELK